MPSTGDWEASVFWTQDAAQEMCEIQSGKWLKLGGAFVAFGDLSTQEGFPLLELANAISRDLRQESCQFQRECLGRGLYGR